MENRIRRYDETKQRELDDQSKRMRKDIVSEIRGQLTTYARSLGYTAVLDSSGDSMNLVPLALYTDATMDITESVISLVNKGKPKVEESTTTTKPAPLRP
jgi:Skp family chaperone for outer membrane proteins